MEATKTCIKCGVEKLVGEFYSKRAQCKLCVTQGKRQYLQEWYAKNRTAVLHASQEPVKKAARARQLKSWKAANADRVRSTNAQNRAQHCQGLSPSYVACKMGIPVAELRQHPELLEMKRSVIRAKRVIRSIEKELKK